MDKIIKEFINSGYIELDKNKFPKSLLWQPDLIFSKEEYTYFVLLKSNNTIPPAFLDRVSYIPNDKYVPLIIFSDKPSKTDQKIFTSLGISFGIFANGKLNLISIKKKRASVELKKDIKRKLEVIDIFISSKQNIEERKFVQDRLELLRKTNYYPFNPPHLIEYDRFDMTKIYEYIDQLICKCEWIIIVLEDNYSDIVSYEIKKSIKIIDHSNIFMFVKSSNTCQIIWKKELDMIVKLQTKSIKYLPYSNITELEVCLTRAIKKRMNEICHENNIELFV